MTDEEKIDVTKCIHFDKSDIPNGCTCYWDGECNHYCYYKKYTYKRQECEKLRRIITKIFACLIKANNRGKIIDTLWVDGITTLWDYIALTLGIKGDQTQIEEQILEKEVNKYKQALDEIIRFFKEDEKFARYSGRPVIFVKPTLEKIEKILKENDIKID